MVTTIIPVTNATTAEPVISLTTTAMANETIPLTLGETSAAPSPTQAGLSPFLGPVAFAAAGATVAAYRKNGR
jgi:hypothetical protein